jgi:hypothetical protein
MRFFGTFQSVCMFLLDGTGKGQVTPPGVDAFFAAQFL